MAGGIRVRIADAAARAVVGDASALRRLLMRAARAALRRQKVVGAELSIALMDDQSIAELNRNYLEHDAPTDVISFALFEEGEPPVGDIYIGAEQAARQARLNDVPIDEELVRLTVHGVLHVLGHDHPEGDDRVASDMWRLQEDVVTQVMQ